MATNSQNPQSPENLSDILQQAQFMTPQQKKDKATGKAIAQKIHKIVSADGGGSNFNFFNDRVAQWRKLDKWAKGTQDMKEFLPYFNITDDKKSHVIIDLTSTKVGPQFVGTLVESMSKNQEYPCVKAVDSGSLDEKSQRQLDALFRMKEAQTIGDLQQQAGVQLEPDNVFVPDDEISAEVYFKLEDRLPKEIRFQEVLSRFLGNSQYEKVYKRKAIRNGIVKNIEVSKIERMPGKQGEYYMRYCIPENTFYNFFMGDTGRHELAWIGEKFYLKIKDLRNKYGIEEDALFKMAKLSSENNGNPAFNWTWKDEFQQKNNRPWDDFSILVYDFEIQLTEPRYFTSSVDSFGKENIVAKKGKPNPTSPKTKAIEKSQNTWHRCVYVPKADEVLIWDLPEIIIRPYNNTFQGFSSYTINIPNNDGEYVPSLFERALEPLKTLTITKMKKKMLIAKLRASGIRIDVESARNITLGDGRIMDWEDVVRVFDQTGNELWSSKGLNPNERAAPAISPMPSDDNLQKIIQLSEVENATIQEIRMLLGVPQYRDGSDVGDRASGKMVENQAASAFNVTDYILNSHHQCLEEVLYKVCILYWGDVVKQNPESREDLINSEFDVEVKIKMTEYERELLEQNIAIWTKTIDGDGNPILSPKDAFRLRNIEDYKLAELVLANTIESNKRRTEQDKQRRAAENMQAQQQSAQQAAQMQAQIEAQKMQAEKEMEEYRGRIEKEKIFLTGAMNIYARGGVLPQQLIPVLQQLVPNLVIPLSQENQQMQQEQQQEQAAQQAQQAQMQQQQQGGQQPTQDQGQQQEQPQEELQETNY